MKTNKITALIATLLLACTSVFADSGTPFGHGESLTFAVGYRAKLVPKTPVGRATLDCEVVDHHGRPNYKITANGRTLPFFRWFFDLDDTYTSHIDTASLRPTQLDIALREEKYIFDAHYIYDWEKCQVATTWKKARWKSAQHKTMTLGESHYDPVALFYNLRTIDPSEYRKGAPNDLHMVLEDTVRIITYTYLGEDEIRLKGIGHIPAYKFTCTIATSGWETFKDGTSCYVWLSADENRIPLWIESPIRVGSVVAYLTEYKNLKKRLKTTSK